MTQIKIEVPANDHIALSAMADALQRIATERAPSVTVGEPVEFYNGSNTEQLNNELEHASRFDVELNRLDEAFEASVQSENTKYDEEFEEVVAGPTIKDMIEDGTIPPLPEQDDTLDKDGIPHDKRIHSKGATRLADNTWRLRKRPADKTEEEWTTYIDSVKAELKAVQDIPVTPPEAEFTEQQAIDITVNANDNPMGVVEPTLDEQAVADLTPPVIETREGPFYWTHDESDSCGEVQTIEELHVIIEGDGHARQIDKESHDKYVEIGYDNGINNVTPPTAPTLTPPVTTTGVPVTPVTPPTSLTPPVVEADKPSVTTFQELMLYMTSAAKKRGADNDMIKATLLEVDPALTAIPLIDTRADLIPKFVTALEAKLL